MAEAGYEEGSFAGAGGVEIHWRAWLPDGPARAVVLIAHGAAEHSGRYDWVAGQLVARGLAVLALDHRGHGRSGGPRAYVDRVDNAVADLHSLARLAAVREPGAPRFLLGHSMGGMVALAYALRHQDELAGLVLSAPLAALSVPAPARLAARALGAVAPRLPLTKIDGTTVSRDPAVVAAYDADPLNHRGALPARTVAEMLATVAALPDRLPELRLPLLTVYGTGDRLVDPAASLLVDERAGSADKTLIAYDGLYHEVLNEPERERVVGAIADWIDARATGRATEPLGGHAGSPSG
ncbi:MAG: alpha/beta hydrolase [Solirubrobacterales bacterium]|nr:alpha/beta hydrolase [Solirubrobacterales bacterium]